MPRLLALVVLVIPNITFAQLDAPPEPVLEPSPSPQPWMPAARTPTPSPEESGYRAVVRAHKPSPQWTQDRSFISTRFWLMDPGNFEVQTWLRIRTPHEINGMRGPSEIRLQQEIEMGVWPHLQIDLYENVTFNVDETGKRGFQQEGVQIEARIAIPRYYGQIPLNPVIYLEWHPRHNNPDRAEVRLLLGGAPTRWLFLAANPYVEFNVQNTDSYEPGLDAMGMPIVVKKSKYLADMEFGTTLAAGFRITDWFRVSAEVKIGADMLGDPNNDLHFVFWAGPGFILKPLPAKYSKYLKIMGTCLFAIPPTNVNAQQFEPLVIVGSQF